MEKVNFFYEKYKALLLMGVVAILLMQSCGAFFKKGNANYSAEQIETMSKQMTQMQEKIDDMEDILCNTTTKADLKQSTIFMLLSEKSLDRNELNQNSLDKMLDLKPNCK